MQKLALAVSFAAAAALAGQPAWAASSSRARHHAAVASCAQPSEAEQAIRYITDLMVASSACGNTIYGKFALRNRTTIIRYQNAMIARLRSKTAFDRWNTSLANQAALRQAGLPLAKFCQQEQPMLTQASTLDGKGFRAVVLAQAASAPKPAGCAERAQR
jgi:hypothetical protein